MTTMTTGSGPHGRKSAADHMRGLSAAFEHITDTVIITDQRGRIEYVNPAFEALTGYGKEELLGKTPRILKSGRHKPQFYADLWRRILSGTPVRTEFINRKKNGQEWVQELTITPLRLPDGPISHFVATGKSVNDREHTEQSLQLHRELLNSANDMIFVLDPVSFVVLDANDAALRELGLVRQALSHTRVDELDARLAVPGTIQRITEQLRTSGHTTYETVYRRKDGSAMDVETKLSLVQLERPFVLGVARDISARKQAETVLRTSEAKLSNAMEMARLGYWEYDAMSDLFTFNDQFYAMLHTTVERVGGYTMSPDSYAQRFIHPDDVPVVRLGIQRARDTAARHYSRELEHRIIYGDGGIGHITVRVFIVKDDHGRTIKTYGVNQDITKRKRAEEALQRSEERYRRLADASFEGIGLITEGTILDLNDQLATMVQGTRSTMIGKDISHFVAPESRDIARRHMQSGCETPHEFLALRTDGSTFPVEARARSVTTDEGRIWVIAIRDITDRKLAERQLVSSLREKEMLLKEIHHRVKNNMQVVSSLLSLGTQKISDPAARGTLQASMNRIRSMALVHETLYRSENFAAIDFKEYLRRETRSLVHSLGKPGVTCAVGGDNIQLPLDTALPCGLVVNELVTNALAHAYPDYRTGTIDVSLSRSDNGRVELTVRDDGVGLPPDSDIKTLASLGMTLVFTLVEQISGTITLDGRNGTRVVVSFPVEYTTLRPHNFPGYRPPAPEAVCRGEKGNA